MKHIRAHLLPALAVIPALVVTGASLIALVFSEAGMATASAPHATLSAGAGAGAGALPTLAHAPVERAGVAGLLTSPVAAIAQLQPERLPRPALQPAPSISRHTTVAPAVMRQSTVAQPALPVNTGGDRSGSNSGQDRGDDRDDDHEGDDDREHGGHDDDEDDDDDDRHDDDDEDDD